MQTWIDRFEARLKSRYFISIEDAGINDAELAGMQDDYPDAPEEAVEAFATDYDLSDGGVW